MKLDHKTYADFMTRLDEVEDLLDDVDPLRPTQVVGFYFQAL